LYRPRRLLKRLELVEPLLLLKAKANKPPNLPAFGTDIKYL
jgi:hypothetical protein